MPQQQQVPPSSSSNNVSNNSSSGGKSSNVPGKFMPQLGLSEFAKLSGDMRASLGLLVENGICKVNGNASLIVMPSTPNYDYKSAGADLLNPLPASAKDIYLRNHGGNPTNSSSSSNRNPTSASGTNKQPLDDEFFADNWYFVELHQSILQESTHSNERYSNL